MVEVLEWDLAGAMDTVGGWMVVVVLNKCILETTDYD